MKKQKWINSNTEDGQGFYHVIPDWDEQPHAFIEEGDKIGIVSDLCPCQPKIEDNLVIHNSFRNKRIANEALKKYEQ